LSDHLSCRAYVTGSTWHAASTVHFACGMTPRWRTDGALMDNSGARGFWAKTLLLPKMDGIR